MTTGVSPTVFEKMANNWVQQQQAAIQAGMGAPTDVFRLAMRPPQSTGAYETYAWLGDLPVVKEWIGQKTARGFRDYGFTIRNKPFYDAVMVDRNDLRDDQVGSHELQIRNLPVMMDVHQRGMIKDLVVNGATDTAFDGVAFFSNASGDRVNDNLLAGTGISLAQLKADLIAALKAMRKFVNSEGIVLNIQGDVIYCPVELEYDFKTLVLSPVDVTTSNPQARNPFAGLTVIGDASLSDANDWYLFATGGILKPFIFQERQAMRSELDDTKVKSERMYYYSVEWDGNAGYGLPLLGVKTVNS